MRIMIVRYIKRRIVQRKLKLSRVHTLISRNTRTCYIHTMLPPVHYDPQLSTRPQVMSWSHLLTWHWILGLGDFQ